VGAFTAFPQKKKTIEKKGYKSRAHVRARAPFRSETGDFVSVTGAQHFASNMRQLGGYIRLI